MKNASWFFALLLGAVFYYALASLPSPSPSPHISLRYAQKAESETGIHSHAGAVLADYRSFDLLAVGILFSVAGLSLLLFFSETCQRGALFPTLLGLAGLVFSLGTGFLSLLRGSNFLDYEALAYWVDSARARADGALILTGGALLSLGGLLLLLIQWLKAPEASHDR